MLLKKKVKGGVLLYALLMSAIFVLLLQFYLGRVLAVQRQNQAQTLSARAYLMAQLTADQADDKSGAVSYKQGRSTWIQKNDTLTVTVTLADGQSYQYHFFKKKAEKEEKKINPEEKRTAQSVAPEEKVGLSEPVVEPAEEGTETKDE